MIAEAITAGHNHSFFFFFFCFFGVFYKTFNVPWNYAKMPASRVFKGRVLVFFFLLFGPSVPPPGSQLTYGKKATGPSHSTTGSGPSLSLKSAKGKEFNKERKNSAKKRRKKKKLLFSMYYRRKFTTTRIDLQSITSCWSCARIIFIRKTLLLLLRVYKPPCLLLSVCGSIEGPYSLHLGVFDGIPIFIRLPQST